VLVRQRSGATSLVICRRSAEPAAQRLAVALAGPVLHTVGGAGVGLGAATVALAPVERGTSGGHATVVAVAVAELDRRVIHRRARFVARRAPSGTSFVAADVVVTAARGSSIIVGPTRA